MEKHYGQIVERTVRRNGYSITELAKLTNVNRRSVYNWFSQKRLKPEIIYRIGAALNHDFSMELYQSLSPDEFNALSGLQPNRIPTEFSDNNYWKDKYIQLLEKFNALLAESDRNSRKF